jgi:N-acyl-D-amino-acid deacylase
VGAAAEQLSCYAAPMRLLLLLLSLTVAAQDFDLLIRNARLIDGTGNPWYRADVAVKGTTIARVAPAGLLRSAMARTEINAAELTLAPGFIDIQSHSRGNLLYGDGLLKSKVTQGITTEILGELWSNAPANEKTRASREAAEPDDKGRFDGAHGFAKWMQAIGERGASANFGSYVGAGSLRAFAKGMAMGKANAAELDVMRAAMREAMQDGAFGLASALIYPPNSFSDTEELIAVSKVAAEYGGTYITHMRSEGDRILEGLEEALRIGREAGIPVEIYHLKAVGRANWNKMPEVIARINMARAAGQDVSADMYPYVASGTGLTTCLPPWAQADGKLFDNLRQPELRRRILDEMQRPSDEWESRCLQAGPEGVLLTGLNKEANRPFRGKRLAEIAAARQKPWAETALDLIASEGYRVGTIFFVMKEENLAEQMKQPWIKFSTDAGPADPEKSSAPTHPRAYGTYPRVLGYYVRERGVLPLEDAIRKMTSAVAQRLALPDRGLVREGMAADLVLFRHDSIADRSTFENPHQLSVGVEHVFVNGVAVVKDAKHTGAKPGKFVRPAQTGKILP